MNSLRVFRFGLLVGARDFAVFWSWKSWFSGWMLRILTTVFLWGMLGKLLGSPEKLHYLMVGFATTAGIGSFAVAAASWDRLEGTYSLLIISPSGIAASLIGRMCIWMFGWIASAGIAFLVVSTALHWHLSVAAIASTLALVVLMSITTFFLTVAVGAIAALAPRIRNMCSFFVTLAIMAFCGVSVPVSFWPGWAQRICNTLPVTHGLQAVRLILAAGPISTIRIQIAFELLTGLGWFAASLLIMLHLAEAGRRDGTIDLE